MDSRGRRIRNTFRAAATDFWISMTSPADPAEMNMHACAERGRHRFVSDASRLSARTGYLSSLRYRPASFSAR